MQWLKQGTTVVMVGPFLKTSDGKSLCTKSTLSTGKVRLSKNDAAFANKASTKASSYSAPGFYRIFLTTADSGTLGRLKISARATEALPVWADYMVMPAVPYNSLIAGTDYLTVDLVQNNGAASTLLATADVDNALSVFVGTTDWNDAIGDLSTLSTGDLDAAVSGYVTTDDLDGITTRLPAALTTDGNIKADAIMVNGATPQKSTDIADAILLTPANLLRTDTEGNVKITTAARAEPGQGAPAVGADLAKKVDYLYKSWRNKKTQDSSTWSLYNDAGAVVDQKATISDDGTTATFGEIVTGA